jgi:signal transduction histidine kinase
MRGKSAILDDRSRFPTNDASTLTTRRACTRSRMYALCVTTLPLHDLARQEAQGPSSIGEARPLDAPRARALAQRAMGVAVVLFIVLLQAVTQYLNGHERARVLGHLGFLAFELPAIMVALSFTYAALKRHHVGAAQSVGWSVLVAGTLGAGFGIVLSLLSQRFPNLTLRPLNSFTIPRAALYGFSFGQFHMGLWALAFAFPFSIDEARMKDLEAARLRSAAELARLRAHLEPHFLLNTLNAIAGLVTEEPREARRLIGCLGDLLRDALHDDDELQTLHAQVAWLQRYAAILQARHPGALTFEWDIEGGTRGVLLPRLLLQPLVENAVKHGALQRAGDGRVLVRVRWGEGDVLECAVEDNGLGEPAQEVRRGAFGLHAVVRRVELKYPGAEVRLEGVLDGADGARSGTRARVSIPRAALDTAASAGRPA